MSTEQSKLNWNKILKDLKKMSKKIGKNITFGIILSTLKDLLKVKFEDLKLSGKIPKKI